MVIFKNLEIVKMKYFLDNFSFVIIYFENFQEYIFYDKILYYRDSLAQLLYEQLIDWLLQRINATTMNGCNIINNNNMATIVLADCYGFEVYYFI